MDTQSLLLFARAVVEHWVQFVTGAVLVGGVVSLAVSIIERLRNEPVRWRTYVAILGVGGLLTATYYAWLDQRQLTIGAEATIQQLRGATANVALGIKETKLIENKDVIKITFEVENYSANTPIENISNAMMIVFGSGKDVQTITATISPSMRLNPQQTHTFVARLAPKHKNAPDPYLALLERKQPIVATLLLYFTVNSVQFSQREVFSYDYVERKWDIAMEQQVEGFVSWPVGVVNGVPQYWQAPWLPSPPTGAACSPAPAPTKTPQSNTAGHV